MARTYLGNASTDSNGIATFEITGSGVGDTVIVAEITVSDTNEIIASNTHTITDAMFYDNAVNGDVNSNYYNTSSRVTVATDSQGKLLSNTSGSTGTYYACPINTTPSTSTHYAPSFNIEADVVDYTGISYIQVSDGTSNFYRAWSYLLGDNKSGHIKFEIKANSQAIYVNGSDTASYTATNSMGTSSVRFNLGNGSSVKFRNLRIYKV